MAKPFAKWQTFVSCKSERLASRRRVEGNVGGNNKYEDQGSQRINSRCANGTLEYIDERIPGRIIKRVVDAVYAKEVGDQEDDGHGSVPDI